MLTKFYKHILQNQIFFQQKPFSFLIICLSEFLFLRLTSQLALNESKKSVGVFWVFAVGNFDEFLSGNQGDSAFGKRRFGRVSF